VPASSPSPMRSPSAPHASHIAGTGVPNSGTPVPGATHRPTHRPTATPTLPPPPPRTP
jgi:hypothetical protein